MNQSNKEKFIEKAKIIHAGENLDYSQVEYVNNRTPVKIIDHDLDENGVEYGEFWQSPNNHLKGQCHPRKRGKRISKSKSFSTDEVIDLFKKIHSGENLDYSQVEYVNMHTKVKIISHDLDENGNEYGEFWQEPCVHLKGCTHPKIGLKKQTRNTRYTTDVFIRKCNELYPADKYSYDSVDYKNSKTKVKIFCNSIGIDGKPHGYFMASPDLFLQGKGCPKCGRQLSKNENEIYEYVCELVGRENVCHNDTKLLGGFELDIYVPKYNFAIEYDSLKWHTEKYGKDRNYHLNKTKECIKRGVTLYHIFEDEYLNHRELILDKISHFLGFNKNKTIIGARKCYIKEIKTEEARKFLDKYHIQGFFGSTYYIAGYYKDKLIGVMCFKKEKENTVELSRFATNINYSCPGLAQKLFNYFIREYKSVNEIKSFLDARWFNISKPNIYDILGFRLVMWEKPDYQYTLGQGKRFHKFGFRKQTLHKKYGFPLTMTENEMTKKLGYEKIWNCGLIKYVWKRE